ncbi:MAG TPA: hypothetical protein VMU51_37840 [Mycobacteriales bacterium]|nr:hypothetical protein [Mycobacteriales bacterium]
MANFLLVYERPTTKLLSMVEFADAGEALDARFTAERTHRGNPDIEVVVLAAKSAEVLRRTHGRYFYSTGQLMENLAQLVEQKLQARPAS